MEDTFISSYNNIFFIGSLIFFIFLFASLFLIESWAKAQKIKKVLSSKFSQN